MVNAPTNTAMPPNTSRNTLRNSTKLFSPSSVKRSSSSAVWTWTLCGSAEARLARTESGPATRTSVKLPPRPNTCWAVSRSNSANVAVPIESTSPKVAMPVISASWTGPSASKRIRSPIAKPCFSAVPASITTSPTPEANSPSLSRNGDSSPASGSIPAPKNGPWPITSPLASSSRASSVMLPTAFSTPGAARTPSSVDAGMSGRTMNSSSGSKAVLADTTAAVPS